MHIERYHNTHRIQFYDGETDSQVVDLRGGAFGTFIIPSGSGVIGKTVQFVAVESETMCPADKTLPDTPLLSTAKTISAAGAAALTADEITEAGGAGHVKFRLNSAVSGDAVIYLLWKA